ncbi:MAG: type VI secretion system lipoprotein TssJ [Myxococcaceae bacterium]
MKSCFTAELTTACAILFIWVGCAHAPAAPCATPPPFHVTVVTGARLNPDAMGRSLPTLVRVLQLKGTTRLEDADFAGVFSRAADVLGEDLVRTDEFTVDPDSSDSRWIERDPKAAHVVAVGVFRQPTGTQWRSAVALGPVEPSLCNPQALNRIGTPRWGDAVLSFKMQDFAIESAATRAEASR